jgi:hypothetical protein
MAKKFNFDTIKEMTPDSMKRALLFLFGAIIILVLGVTVGSNVENGMLKGLFIIGGLVGGCVMGYQSYKIVIDKKNEKTCNASWTEYTNIAKPTDEDLDTEEDISECTAKTNAYYKGYAGVWVKPAQSPTTSGNVDAIYFPGDSESYTATTDSSGGKLYARNADKNKDQKAFAVTVSGGTTPPRSPASPA